MQSTGGGKPSVSQGNPSYAYNTPGMTDITGSIFNQFPSLQVNSSNPVSYQPLQPHQQPAPYYGGYPQPPLMAYNPLPNVYSGATAGFPSYDPAIQACYSVPSETAAPVLQGTVSNGTTYYYNPPPGGVVKGSGGGSSASTAYANVNKNVPSVEFASQGVVVPPSLHSNAAAFAGPAKSSRDTPSTKTPASTTAAAAHVVVHSSSTPSALTGQKQDQQGSSVTTSNSASLGKCSEDVSGNATAHVPSSSNESYEGSNRRQQDRRVQNGRAQRGKANFRNPDPAPIQGNSQTNSSTYNNSDFTRGKRRDNYNNNTRGRGGAVYYNSSGYDDEDRNKGRSAVLAEAAAFMSNLNIGASNSTTTTGDFSSSNESQRRGGNSRDRGRYQNGQQSGMRKNPPRLMEGAEEREENDLRFGRGGRLEYDSEGRGRGGRRGGGARGRGRGAAGGLPEQTSLSQQEQQTTGRASGPNRMGEGGRRGGAGRNDAMEGDQRNNRNWNNRNRYPGYGEGQFRDMPNNSLSNQTRNGNGYRNDDTRNKSTSPDTSEASSLHEGSNTNQQHNPFQGGGRNPLTRNQLSSRDHRNGENSTAEQQQRPDDVRSLALKGPNRNFRAGVKLSGNTEEDTKNQRDELTDLLHRGTYECMVCCDRVRPQQAIWSCRMCYNCFHLGCIKKWANSSTKEGESGWRCPGCNNQSAKRPNSYMCFCGKLREPEYNRRDVPHSCGELCGRARESQTWCTHRCNVLCHPGPCPPCLAYIKKWCGCGATSKDVRCNNGADALLCGAVCGKALSCTHHTCQKTCHEGECGDCETPVEQVCHCGKTKQSVKCDSDSHDVLTFECGERCDRLLECDHHHCQQECHDGSCQPCQLTVDLITHCPCGKKSLKDIQAQGIITAAKKKKTGAGGTGKSDSLLADAQDSKASVSKTGSKALKKDVESASEEAKVSQDDACLTERRVCTDPVPTCGAVCGKKLRCGKPGSFHTCKNLCHEGPCPTCPLKTSVRCRCGSMDQNVECSKLLTKADEVTCERQCKKLRFCGRHRCGTKCCIDVDHVCPLRCGKYLSCGNHRCTDTCHRGNCQRCWESSWDELTCHCGASVTFPPVPCGTKPPSCSQLCSRAQSCTHPVSHTCHPEETCPPCTMLMPAPCFGGHKSMRSTPCYLKAMSCGDLCDKPLACGFHKCNKVCHDGPCVKAAASAAQQQKCPQKCTKLRTTCGHPCNQPCHAGQCPNTNCKEKVTVTCKCSQRTSLLSCAENEREYRTMATAKLASQLHHVRNSDDSVDLSHILTAQAASKERFKRLECNDACHSKERASRLALALQIENPESRSSLGTAATAACYSDFLKDEAKKDPQFGGMVHQALTSLVLKARESKQRSRSHSFAPMSRDKRQFIHDYCKFFGCSSMSYDEEPKKNVVVTAQRGMCLLPVNSVVSVIQRENGQKKVPGPVWGPRRPAAPLLSELRSPSNNGGLRKLEKGGSLEREGDTTPTASEASSSKPAIDYFDFDE